MRLTIFNVPTSITKHSLNWLFALFLIALFASLHNDNIWSAGMDLPHHVALAAYIADHAALPMSSTASLSEMASYPPGSHIAAAVASMALDSPLAGVKLIADLSLVATWMLAGYFLILLGREKGLLALVFAMLLLVLNKYFFGTEVIGDELIVNEFYSQLVGQALAFAALAACAKIEVLGTPFWMKYIILTSTCTLLVNVHLLPAVILFSTFSVVLGIDVAKSRHQRPTSRVLVGSALLILCACYIYSSGYTSAMRGISQLGGVIPLRRIANLSSVVIFALATLSLGLWLIIQSVRNADQETKTLHLGHKYIGAIGIATSGLCLLQVVLYSSFGIGSVYACSKYVFLLGTIFLLSVAIIASEAIVGTRSTGIGRLTRMTWWLPACVAAFGFLAAEITVQATKFQSTRNLSRLLAAASAYASDPLSSKRQNIAVGIGAAYPAGDYLVSLVGLGATARSPLTLALLNQQAIPSIDELGDIITFSDSREWNIEACKKADLPEGLVALDGHCVVGSSSRYCRSNYDFTSSGSIAMQKVETHGLSKPEIDGTWTEGTEVLFSCELNPSTAGSPMKVTIDSTAFLYGELKSQVMTMSIGTKEMTVKFDASDQSQLSSIELDSRPANKLVIRLGFPDAASPAQLDLNKDSRKLGVKIRSISIE